MRGDGWAMVVVALVGCGPPNDEADFEVAFSGLWCERQDECARGEFERAWDSLDECRNDVEDDLGIPGWDDHDCDFDPDGGGACLEYLHDTDCAGWEGKQIDDACKDAYRC